MAMARFNLSHVLPDPTGQMTRPLVVRPANLRPGAPVAGGRFRPRPLGYSPQAVAYGAQLGYLEGQADQQQYQQQAAAYGGIPDLQQPQQQYMQQFQPQQFQQQQNLQQQFQQQQFQQQQYAGEGQQEPEHQLHHEPLQQPGMYLQGPPAASLPGLQPAALAPAQAAMQPFQQMMAAAPGYQLARQQVAPQQLQPTVTLSMQLSTQQMASISEPPALPARLPACSPALACCLAVAALAVLLAAAAERHLLALLQASTCTLFRPCLARSSPLHPWRAASQRCMSAALSSKWSTPSR
jgi:hypothetical protein